MWTAGCTVDVLWALFKLWTARECLHAACWPISVDPSRREQMIKLTTGYASMIRVWVWKCCSHVTRVFRLFWKYVRLHWSGKAVPSSCPRVLRFNIVECSHNLVVLIDIFHCFKYKIVICYQQRVQQFSAESIDQIIIFCWRSCQTT